MTAARLNDRSSRTSPLIAAELDDSPRPVQPRTSETGLTERVNLASAAAPRRFVLFAHRPATIAQETIDEQTLLQRPYAL